MANLQQITIQDLQPGMYVTQILEQQGPVKIRKSGHIHTIDMVKGLTEMGVVSLEIDIDQTITMETQDSQTPSQTQTLLQQTSSRQLDNQMSEQFNRSVFLPSIQRMPSYLSRLGSELKYILTAGILGLFIGYLGVWGVYNYASIETEAKFAVTSPAEESAPSVMPSVTSSTPPEKIETVEPIVDAPVVEEETGRLLTGNTSDVAPPSPEIQAKLAEALAALDDLPVGEPVTQVKVTSSDDLPRIAQLPARLLTRMPNMVFAQHMYSSDAENRWVRVNNRRMQEGDMIDGRVRIEQIEPQHVVLSIDGTRFTMDALTDW